MKTGYPFDGKKYEKLLSGEMGSEYLNDPEVEMRKVSYVKKAKKSWWLRVEYGYGGNGGEEGLCQ